MAKALPRYVSAFTDRHGKVRYRFRKTGIPARYIDARPGTPEFNAFVDECMAGVLPAPGARGIKYPAGRFVYFVGQKGGDFIKIGWTGNLRQRLIALSTSSAKPLQLLAYTPGGPVLEKHFHAAFATSRAEGEWFARTPELEALIAELATLLKPD